LWLATEIVLSVVYGTGGWTLRETEKERRLTRSACENKRKWGDRILNTREGTPFGGPVQKITLRWPTGRTASKIERVEKVINVKDREKNAARGGGKKGGAWGRGEKTLRLRDVLKFVVSRFQGRFNFRDWT